MLCNAVTVDVEDYFHVSAFERVIDRANWDGFESRVQRNTQRLLQMLERKQVRGTFFVLGWVARRHPGLVREIHRAGHEIGCHSYWHRLIYRMTPEEFRRDVREAKQAICDVIGQPVRVYRAPSYSITRESLWALEILADEGFEYDSSIYPVGHDRYGIPGAPTYPYRLDCQSRLLWEFPLPAFPVCGMHLPVGGGGYFRLLPVAMTLSCLRAINRRLGRPFAVTIHPWEIDPEQPRIAGSLLSRFRHYVNLHSTAEKLDSLLDHFEFDALTSALDRYSAGRATAPESSTNGRGRLPAPCLPVAALMSRVSRTPARS